MRLMTLEWANWERMQVLQENHMQFRKFFTPDTPFTPLYEIIVQQLSIEYPDFIFQPQP